MIPNTELNKKTGNTKLQQRRQTLIQAVTSGQSPDFIHDHARIVDA